MPAETLTPKRRSTTALDAVAGLRAVVMAALVMALLYFTRDILIPLALAVILTFLLTPLVARLELRIGRIAAVLVVVLLVSSCAGVAGWVLTRQLTDFAQKLPDYKGSIQTKLRSMNMPGGGTGTPAAPAQSPQATGKPDAPQALGAMATVESMASPLLGPLGMAALVLVLVIAMLLRREGLRRRLVRLLGQGHISATTKALDDAGARVSRYLLMQLAVNICYGVPIAVGLYFIGVPHAVLWGALAIVLRFIPYAGLWVAAILPAALSVAVSTGWTMPLLTVGLFIGWELFLNRVAGSLMDVPSTGVSSLALIVAAVFWTWLWGPIGLVLAAPLTVCLVVMGRHVPRLQFLSILLSDQQTLTPAEECYQRLLALDLNETGKLIDGYLRKNSLTALYDSVLIPVITAAEVDHQREMLDDQQHQIVEVSVGDFIEDLVARPISHFRNPVDQQNGQGPAKTVPAWRFLCLPVRDVRDELAGAMLVHLLREQGFQAENLSAQQVSGEAVIAALKSDLDAVCISVVPPSTVLHARHLCMRLRTHAPGLKIAVGLWGATENLADAAQRLREAGADAVVTTLADAVVQLAKLAPPADQPMSPAPIPENEPARLEALCELHLLNGKTEPYFDRATRKLSRIFDVPIALVTLVDRERQVFKGQTGLPEELAVAGESPRETSICGHVVAGNDTLIVEDVRRDGRFAANPLLKQYGILFYAGIPLRAPDGQPVGSLSILDIHPRRLTERDLRLLHVIAEDVTEEIARHAESGESKADEESPEPMESVEMRSPR
jgi:predicted PurR-regulated permease PerM/methylmalonyl-CoA mutase cobalamin-binding subunit